MSPFVSYDAIAFHFSYFTHHRASIRSYKVRTVGQRHRKRESSFALREIIKKAHKLFFKRMLAGYAKMGQKPFLGFFVYCFGVDNERSICAYAFGIFIEWSICAYALGIVIGFFAFII